MLTGMSSTEMARSVPWSRLKPRKKYWLALPSPLCWVMIRPGTTSRASAGRENGHALTSAPLTFFSLEDMTGNDAADVPAAFPADEALTTDAGFLGATRFERLPLPKPCFGLILTS